MIEPKLKKILEADFAKDYDRMIELSQKNKAKKDYLLRPEARKELKNLLPDYYINLPIEDKGNFFEIKDKYGEEAECTVRVSIEDDHLRFYIGFYIIDKNKTLEMSTGYWDDIYKELTGKYPEPIKIATLPQLKKVLGLQRIVCHGLKYDIIDAYDVYSEFKKREYRIEPKLKTALENINFVDRYEALLKLHESEDVVPDIAQTKPVVRKEAELVLNEMGVEYKTNKREFFFRIQDHYGDSAYFFINIIVEYSAFQLFSGFILDGGGVDFGGNTWSSLYNLLKFGDVEGEGRYPRPRFVSCSQLEKVLKEELSIYNDFQKEVLKLYNIDPKTKK